jgi:hypothetical protein
MSCHRAALCLDRSFNQVRDSVIIRSASSKRLKTNHQVNTDSMQIPRSEAPARIDLGDEWEKASKPYASSTTNREGSANVITQNKAAAAFSRSRSRVIPSSTVPRRFRVTELIAINYMLHDIKLHDIK